MEGQSLWRCEYSVDAGARYSRAELAAPPNQGGFTPSFCEGDESTPTTTERSIMLTITLTADKVTRGTIRFMEPDVPEGQRALSIYLPKERVEALGLPTDGETDIAIKMTVERA